MGENWQGVRTKPPREALFLYTEPQIKLQKRKQNSIPENFWKKIIFFKKSVDKCYENEYNNFCSREIWLINKEIEAWLSLVERCVRDAEAAGSNPVASTKWLGTPENLIL